MDVASEWFGNVCCASSSQSRDCSRRASGILEQQRQIVQRSWVEVDREDFSRSEGERNDRNASDNLVRGTVGELQSDRRVGVRLERGGIGAIGVEETVRRARVDTCFGWFSERVQRRGRGLERQIGKSGSVQTKGKIFRAGVVYTVLPGHGCGMTAT